MASWRQQRYGYAKMLDDSLNFAGSTDTTLMLADSEAVFVAVSAAGLVETRAGQGHYQEHSSGISVPVASIGGHAVRYHVGASKGHYVAGAPVEKMIDTGTIYVTNRRLVFEGAAQTRQCEFAKLVSYHHDPAAGTTTLAVTNRQKPTTVHYGPSVAALFDFRFDLALAHFHDRVDDLVATMQQHLAQVNASKPS